MCFFIHPKYPKTLVAKKDIVCYKYGTVFQQKDTFTFQPYFMTCFRYIQNVVAKIPDGDQEIWPRIEYFNQVFVGFHSYSSKKKLLKEKCGFPGSNAVRCIIPKGAKYLYAPDRKEYMSNELMVVERLW